MKFDFSNLGDDQLRDLLVQISLEWEKRFAVAPRITDSIAEYDAAKLVGTSLRLVKDAKKETLQLQREWTSEKARPSTK